MTYQSAPKPFGQWANECFILVDSHDNGGVLPRRCRHYRMVIVVLCSELNKDDRVSLGAFRSADSIALTKASGGKLGGDMLGQEVLKETVPCKRPPSSLREPIKTFRHLLLDIFGWSEKFRELLISQDTQFLGLRDPKCLKHISKSL